MNKVLRTTVRHGKQPLTKARTVQANQLSAVNKKAEWFMPGDFNTTAVLIGKRSSIMILLTPEVYKKFYYIVEAAPAEFGWLGEVEREGMNFTITEVYLLDQTVSGTTVDLNSVPDDNPIGELFFELIEKHGAEKANRVRAWIHSHAYMGVFPSGTYQQPQSIHDRGDLQQMFQFGSNGSDYFIMGIANKKGSLRFEVFFYDDGIRVMDVPWRIIGDEDKELQEQIEKEVAAKSRPAPIDPPTSYPVVYGVDTLYPEDYYESPAVRKKAAEVSSPRKQKNPSKGRKR